MPSSVSFLPHSPFSHWGLKGFLIPLSSQQNLLYVPLPSLVQSIPVLVVTVMAAEDKPKTIGKKHNGKQFLGSPTSGGRIRLVLTEPAAALGTEHQFSRLFSQ